MSNLRHVAKVRYRPWLAKLPSSNCSVSRLARGSEISTDAYLRSVELKLGTWVFFCGDHAPRLRLRLTSARRSTARKLRVAAKTMRRRMLNRGRTERFCGCGSFMGFAKDGHVYGLVFVGSGSDPLSSSVLGVFLDIGRDGMLKD